VSKHVISLYMWHLHGMGHAWPMAMVYVIDLIQAYQLRHCSCPVLHCGLSLTATLTWWIWLTAYIVVADTIKENS